MLTQGRIKELLRYDKTSGDLIWKVRRGGNAKAGDVAGTLFVGRGKGSYINVKIDGKVYLSHRVIWMYVHGIFPKEVDHIDGDGLNNSLLNLREVDRQGNCKNRKIPENNTSGQQGVSWDKKAQKWYVRVNIDKKRVSLGYFASKEEAIRVRKQAEIKYNYHENHGRLKG